MRSAELRDLTLGVVGYGAIGQAVARLSRANGLAVIAHLRAGRPERCVEGVTETASLDEVIGGCHVLVLALPLTRETRHLIGAANCA